VGFTVARIGSGDIQAMTSGPGLTHLAITNEGELRAFDFAAKAWVRPRTDLPSGIRSIGSSFMYPRYTAGKYFVTTLSGSVYRIESLTTDLDLVSSSRLAIDGVVAASGNQNVGYALKKDGTAWRLDAVPTKVPGLTDICDVRSATYLGGSRDSHALLCDGRVFRLSDGAPSKVKEVESAVSISPPSNGVFAWLEEKGALKFTGGFASQSVREPWPGHRIVRFTKNEEYIDQSTGTVPMRTWFDMQDDTGARARTTYAYVFGPVGSNVDAAVAPEPLPPSNIPIDLDWPVGAASEGIRLAVRKDDFHAFPRLSADERGVENRTVLVPPGGEATIVFDVVRTGGFQGPVTIRAATPLAGFTFSSAEGVTGSTAELKVKHESAPSFRAPRRLEFLITSGTETRRDYLYVGNDLSVGLAGGQRHTVTAGLSNAHVAVAKADGTVWTVGPGRAATMVPGITSAIAVSEFRALTASGEVYQFVPGGSPATLETTIPGAIDLVNTHVLMQSGEVKSLGGVTCMGVSDVDRLNLARDGIMAIRRDGRAYYPLEVSCNAGQPASFFGFPGVAELARRKLVAAGGIWTNFIFADGTQAYLRVPNAPLHTDELRGVVEISEDVLRFDDGTVKVFDANVTNANTSGVQLSIELPFTLRSMPTLSNIVEVAGRFPRREVPYRDLSPSAAYALDANGVLWAWGTLPGEAYIDTPVRIIDGVRLPR
jgi:hypothetical protein